MVDIESAVRFDLRSSHVHLSRTLGCFLYCTDYVWGAVFQLIRSGHFRGFRVRLSIRHPFSSLGFPTFRSFRWWFELLALKLRLAVRYSAAWSDVLPSLRSGGSIYCHLLLSMSELNKSVLSASAVRLFSASALRFSVTVVRWNQSGHIQHYSCSFLGSICGATRIAYWMHNSPKPTSATENYVLWSLRPPKFLKSILIRFLQNFLKITSENCAKFPFRTFQKLVPSVFYISSKFFKDYNFCIFIESEKLTKFLHKPGIVNLKLFERFPLIF